MKKSKSKWNFKRFGLFLAIGLILAHGLNPWKSEHFIKNRVIKLTSGQGGCSGEQIHAPSGKDYILTAAHCIVLKNESNEIQATTEYGVSLPRKIIAEDPYSDLLLLEGIPGLRGLDIAESDYRNQEIRTFTHGALLDTYKTTGVLINDREVQVPIDIISSEAQEAACIKMPKNKVGEINIFGLFVFKVCVLNVDEIATTAMIVPGSSGGPVVDGYGDLVGVVSAGGNGFGWLVTLHDIRHFLHNY